MTVKNPAIHCDNILCKFQYGILVAGGYYNGISTMFHPLTEYLSGRTNLTSGWRWTGNLTKERKWSPSLGLVDGRPTIAGGDDYGDDTVDHHGGSGGGWRRNSEVRMRWKREFAGEATVPSQWFPQCSPII